jgi:flagellar assembly factor FliW
MLLDTARFGQLPCSPRELLLFPEGIIGFEHLHAWLLAEEQPLVWLQAVENADVALPLVSPYLFVPEYRLQISADDRRSLQLTAEARPFVLVVVSQHDSQWTINLRAPLLIRPELQLGRQVVTDDEQPLRHVLPRSLGNFRKSA